MKKTLKAKWKAGKGRKNLLDTFCMWGGKGVEEPEALMTYVDHEIGKFLARLESK